MRASFSPSVVREVLGGSLEISRVPLHIPAPVETVLEVVAENQIDIQTKEGRDEAVKLLEQANFSIGNTAPDREPPELIPAKEIEFDQVTNPRLFNAIGSLANGGGGNHLPIFDIDGGVHVSDRMGGRKAVLFPSHEGALNPRSDLPDILEENHGITMTVREVQHLKSGGMMHPEPTITGNRVASVTLKTRDLGTFVGYDSSTPQHGHLYIQRKFTDEEYQEMVATFLGMGIVSERWADIVHRTGQGILRTPWAQKPVDAYSS